MAPQAETFTIGVEEEYQIIHPKTRQLWGRSPHILPIAQSALDERLVQPEFRLSQLEVATPICHSLQEVRLQLLRLRREVVAAAAATGSQIAAAGTHPFSCWREQLITPKACYQKLAERYQRLMHELVTFGCHVHIGLGDRELAVQVMNRARIWLAPLLALSASSPFWLGADTGYASYRTVLISRLPMTGPPLIFQSYSDYQGTVQSLIATQTIQEATQICWDLRLSERFPTIEFRVADACSTVDEAVLMAGLARALVRTCYEEALQDRPYKAVRPELLRAAHWCAARSGLAGDLIDVEVERPVPAEKLVGKLLNYLRPALQAFEEWEEVGAIAQQILQRGTATDRQRMVYRQTGSLERVVDFLVQETGQGLHPNPESLSLKNIPVHPLG
ncbi:MAG: carboxylate-amine ligase [Synechococcales bacterium]|nr:carboxylate-amine ligase [Synechococcales bacterium]